MSKLKKILLVSKRIGIQQLQYVSMKAYMKNYIQYLKSVGMNIEGTPNYIGNDVYFDGKDYSCITLGDNITISKGAILLTHDYCMHTVYKNLDIQNIEKVRRIDAENSLLILESIIIGRNSFIGKRATILPGTTIGENVIVGACSVVKGKIPDNSIVVGNPGKIIGKTSEWIDRKINTM